GIPEWLTPEVGRLVEFGDLEAFANTAVDLLISGELPQMRQTARQYAQTHFDPEVITSQYEKVYRAATEAATVLSDR
ncbi:MAG: N-acetyl-alpha-D-glucosaminyl L-malate synthase BshA, partial [Meiothermus sp.]